jgi:mevalonate kinase
MENGGISPIQADRIIKDIEEGWVYQSDIPIGYGLGSSGAFVAALYDRYLAPGEMNVPLTSLGVLSKMEEYFHGTSSGMDPLVSYAQSAVYKDENGIFQTIADPGWAPEFQVYLLDSGTGRSTGPLVSRYKQKLEDDDFKRRIENDFIPVVEHAIHFYLSGSFQMLEEYLQMISQFQREYFSMFIPDEVQQRWDKWMTLPGVYVKFCGAGGGGYFLVISTSGEANLNLESLTRIV